MPLAILVTGWVLAWTNDSIDAWIGRSLFFVLETAEVPKLVSLLPVSLSGGNFTGRSFFRLGIILLCMS